MRKVYGSITGETLRIRIKFKVRERIPGEFFDENCRLVYVKKRYYEISALSKNSLGCTTATILNGSCIENLVTQKCTESRRLKSVLKRG